MTTILFRQNRIFFSLIICIFIFHAMPTVASAIDGQAWLAAYQAYVRLDYGTAHQGFVQLLQGDLTATEQIDLLRYEANCLQKLGKPAEAAAAWEKLYQLAANDPHFDGLAYLYRYYLDSGDMEKAEGLWNSVIQRWGGIAGVWKLVAQHTDYLAQRNPALIVTVAEQLAPLTIAKDDLVYAFYRPLFRYGHYEQARQVHASLQQYFANHRPEAVELDKRAYEDAVSDDIIEAVFANFVKALAAEDFDAARTWLANLNGTVPEHQRSVEARKLYREKMATIDKGK